MGVKGLWSVLAPFGEKKSLHEIRGETLAIDLSGWVCDSQNVTDCYVQPRLYLRNLFFRTLYLLLDDVKPVFVLEGDAPELKRDAMAARNAIQFRGRVAHALGKTKIRPDTARKRFRGILRQCESLLKCMGVSCVKGHGEAEATCAQLNSQGLVYAVVSQDSDCFAYGARRVYRNFSVTGSAGGGAARGSIDVFDADKMAKDTGFGRNKMVALALLCGCDYGAGACGSSIATTISFLHTVPDDEIIPRLLSWVSDSEKYEELQCWVSAPGRCHKCGHLGRHKNGCSACGTDKDCYDNEHKSKMADVKRELSLRNRALSHGVPFPDPNIMKEFLDVTPETIDPRILVPTIPSLVSFVKLMGNKLEWPERYCVEKFLPLLTCWHLKENVTGRTIRPISIKKKRNLRGVPSYEVVWEDIDGQYEGLIPDEQFEADEDPLSAWTTIERQDLMKLYYPELVGAFEESIKKPPKEKKGRGKKKKESTEEVKPKRKYTKKPEKLVNSILENLQKSIKLVNSTKDVTLNTTKVNVSVSVNRLKRKLKNNSAKSKNQRSITSFVSKKRKSDKNLISCLVDSLQNISLNNSKEELNLKNTKNEDKKHQDIDKPSLSFFDSTHDEIDENDLSVVVEKIVKRTSANKTVKVNNNLVRLIFTNSYTPKKSSFHRSVLNEMRNCSTPNQSPSKKTINNSFNVNTSYFFDKLTDVCDAFEMSTDYKNLAVEDTDCDKTMEYNYSYRDLSVFCNKEEINHES